MRDPEAPAVARGQRAGARLAEGGAVARIDRGRRDPHFPRAQRGAGPLRARHHRPRRAARMGRRSGRRAGDRAADRGRRGGDPRRGAVPHRLQHERHGFCAHCGAPTRVDQAGWKRRCPECKAQHYPRADPVTIMLTVRGEYGLLGRNKRRPGSRDFRASRRSSWSRARRLKNTVRREVMRRGGGQGRPGQIPGGAA